MKKIYSFLTVAALLLAGFTSCAVDQDGTTPQNTTPGYGTKVTIKINNGAAAKTRATAGTASTLTGADRENQITNLYAVLYKDKNSSYAYYKTFACTQDATNTDEYTFDVEDEAAGGVYYMYLIANPTTELKTVFDNDNAGASANSIDTEADLYAFTVTPVLGPTADDTDNTKNNINKVTDFVMTSPRVQLDMAGDEETVVGGTDGITLTRLAARFDIDATALNITNADPSKETTFQITKVTMNKRYTESDLIRGGIRGISMAHPTTASTDLASSANVEFDKFLTEANYIDADGKYWYGAIYSCENYDTTDPVALTIEGVYKHGENQALTVSQNVVFKDIQRDGSGNITSQDIIPIQRNHLYKVILTPKYNNGALVFDAIDYAIQVNDWQTGETLVFAGDDKLTATAIPDFVVEGAVYSSTELEYDGVHNPNRVTAGVMEKTFRVIVTSPTTGTMLECPEFDSTKGSYGLVSTSNDANGKLVETYEIHVNENVLANHKTFTFRINNAINTAYARTFVLRGGVDPSELRYGDIIYDDCTIVHLGGTKPTGKTAVALVVYTSDSPTAICEAGVRNDAGEAIIGKALAIALYDADSSNNAKWGNDGVNEDNTLFPNISTIAACKADLRGYEKTKYLTSSASDGGCGHGTHDAARLALNYHSNKYGNDESVVSKEYLIGSSGWFLPSGGQAYYMEESTTLNGNSSGTNKASSFTMNNFANTSANAANQKGVDNLKNLLENWAGGNSMRIINSRWTWTSSEVDPSTAIAFHGWTNGWGLANGVENKSESTRAVRAFIAY